MASDDRIITMKLPAKIVVASNVALIHFCVLALFRLHEASVLLQIDAADMVPGVDARKYGDQIQWLSSVVWILFALQGLGVDFHLMAMYGCVYQKAWMVRLNAIFLAISYSISLYYVFAVEEKIRFLYIEPYTVLLWPFSFLVAFAILAHLWVDMESFFEPSDDKIQREQGALSLLHADGESDTDDSDAVSIEHDDGSIVGSEEA